MSEAASVQPTEIQVQRSLLALQEPVASFGGLSGLGPMVELGTVPPGLLDLLVEQSLVRPDRVADAQMRMAGGEHPTDDDLAGRMVGRLVCDRLR